MFAVQSSRTMANARPKFREDDVVVRDLVKIRAERAARPVVEVPPEVVRVSKRKAKEQQKRERIERERRQNMIDRAVDRLGTGPLDTIIRRAVRVFRVTPAEMASPSRADTLVMARCFIAYWSRRRTDASFPQVARRLSRDHSTLIYSAQVYPAKRAKMGRTLRSYGHAE